VAKGRRSNDLSKTGRDDINVDGAVRDRDLFVLGDFDDEDMVDLESKDPDDTVSTNEPSHQSPPATKPPTSVIEAQVSSQPPVPPKYHLKRGDTLLGIAFRFKVDVRTTRS
jgi:hypothetical protein